MEELKNEYKKIDTLLSEFESMVRNKCSLEKQLEEIRTAKQEIEYKIKEKVFSEIDRETGKKKYSNEAMRNIAEYNQLSADEEYKKLNSASNTISDSISKLNNEITILSKRLSMMQKQVDLLVAIANLKGLENGKN
jgi:chaperonin cofactor prefoldin